MILFCSVQHVEGSARHCRAGIPPTRAVLAETGARYEPSQSHPEAWRSAHRRGVPRRGCRARRPNGRKTCVDSLKWQGAVAPRSFGIENSQSSRGHTPCGDGWAVGSPTKASPVRRHSPHRRSRARSARLPSLLYLGMPRERTHGAAWHPRRAATRPDSAGRANRSVVIRRASVDTRRLRLQLEVISGHGLENVPPFHRCLLGGPFGRSCRAPFRLAAARDPARSPPVSPRRVAPSPPMDRRSVLGDVPTLPNPGPGEGGSGSICHGGKVHSDVSRPGGLDRGRPRSPRRTSGVVGRLEAATGRFHRSRATRDLPDESQHEPFGNRINSPGQATRKTHDLCFKLNQSLSGDRTPCAALLNQNISRRNRFASLLNQFVKSRQPACEAIVSARRSNARAGQFRSVQMTG